MRKSSWDLKIEKAIEDTKRDMQKHKKSSFNDVLKESMFLHLAYKKDQEERGFDWVESNKAVIKIVLQKGSEKLKKTIGVRNGSYKK